MLSSMLVILEIELGRAGRAGDSSESFGGAVAVDGGVAEFAGNRGSYEYISARSASSDSPVCRQKLRVVWMCRA